MEELPLREEMARLPLVLPDSPSPGDLVNSQSQTLINLSRQSPLQISSYSSPEAQAGIFKKNSIKV